MSAEPLRHYLKGVVEVQAFRGDDVVSAESREARCREIASGAGRVWLSLCREWLIDPAGDIHRWFDENMILVGSYDFPGIRVFLYEQRGA